MPSVHSATTSAPATRRGAQRLFFARGLIVSIVAALVLSACGSSDDGLVDAVPDSPADQNGPRVADPRFDGEFIVAALNVDGTEVVLVAAPLLVFETEFGGLTLNPGCNTYFGSFTLAEDNTASFTIGGGSDEDCEGLAAQEQAVLAALAEVTSWTETRSGFTFEGPNSSLSVSRN